MPTRKPAASSSRNATGKPSARQGGAAKPVKKARTAAAKPKAIAPEAKVAEPPAAEIKPECHHAWMIEPPNGPTSDGACTICGETREFRNSYEYTPSWTARSGKGAAASNGGTAKPAAGNGAGSRPK